MMKKVEVMVDDDLVQEVIHRYRVLDTNRAIHLALRSILGLAGSGNAGDLDEEYDEFSDLRALVRQPSGNAD
jgi:Arc/MetJ family transcription regulator